MHRYFSTFAAGFENIVGKILQADKKRIMPGAILYDTAAAPDEIRKIRYFKNSFIVIKEFPKAKSLVEMANKGIIQWTPSFDGVTGGGSGNDNRERPPRPAGTPPQEGNLKSRMTEKTFKLTFSDRNKLVAVDGKIKARLVDNIERATGLKYGKTGGDIEFVMLLRDDGNGFLLRRITKNSEAALPGQLESHVAHLLVQMGEPTDTDIFIDPFCGSGAIPLARAAAPYRGIFAMDNNPELVKNLKAKVAAVKNSKMQKSFFVKPCDFLDNKFEDGFADVITTDPPWGEFQKIDLDFYGKAFQEFIRILKPGGRLTLLVGRDVKLPALKELAKKTELDVLIHGKKAKVLVFERR